MSAPWSGDFWSRIGAGVSPWTALTTAAPKAADSMSGTTYDSNSQQAASDARAGLAGAPGSGTPSVMGAATAPTVGGGGPAIDPNVAKYKQEVADRIKALQAAYDGLFGEVDANVADQKATYDKSFASAQDSAAHSFENTTGQLGVQFAGRGLGDSSYLGDAQGQAKSAFDADTNNRLAQRDSVYAGLGKFATTQKASLGAGKAAVSGINLADYTDPNQLLSLRDQIDQQLATVSQTRAGLGTSAQFRGALTAAAPAATDATTAALQKQLDTLSKSSASPMTKNTIATGLIKAAGISPDQSQYWLDYFQRVGAAATPTTAG